MNFIEFAVAFVVTISVTLVLYFKWIYSFWRRRNVEYIEPRIPFGNLENPLFMKQGFTGLLKNSYLHFKAKGKRYGGIYLVNKPIFVPTDPDLIKNILTKDFQHFMNHGNLLDEKTEPLSANLLNLEDDRWKNLRVKLTPTFTSGKMKVMFNNILTCGHQLVEYLKMLSAENKPLEVKDIINRYTIDVIGSNVFGLDCNCFKNPDAEFRKYAKKATEVKGLQALRLFIFFLLPELNKLLKMRLVEKDVADFFTNAFKDVINHRKDSSFKRNDFVQLLMETGASHMNPSYKLNTDEMVTQAILFFIAGFDTSSSNLSFALYKLALHQNVQDKLRAEVMEVLGRNNGDLTYEALSEMKYMDQVLDETLRFYPPLPFLNRKCSKDYIVPGTDLKLEKGVSVMISAIGLHMDEEYYPDPEKFDPDRFSKENKEKRHNFVHLPFGEGPRVCIGQRFATLQVKIGLSLIMKNFKILPHETTPKSFSHNPKSPTITCPETLLLRSELL